MTRERRCNVQLRLPELNFWTKREWTLAFDFEDRENVSKKPS